MTEDSSEWIGSLDDEDVRRFVDSYLKNKTWLENDDPISHMAHFVQIAYDIPGVVAINPVTQGEDRQPNVKPWLRFVRAAAIYLHAINPSFTKGDWAQLFNAVLRRLHGGTFVRIRKRPKLGLMLDARFMMPKQLMTKYNVSRSHAYKARKDALALLKK